MFTSYDGKKVFDKLKDTDKIEFAIDNNVFAKIEKGFTDKTFKNYGQEINIWVDKIGVEHKEYLVNEQYVTKQFKKHNINLIEAGNFIDPVDDFRLPLTVDEKEYIKLHKYYIFEKT